MLRNLKNIYLIESFHIHGFKDSVLLTWQLFSVDIYIQYKPYQNVNSVLHKMEIGPKMYMRL